MRQLVLFSLSISAIISLTCGEKLHPLSDEFINTINSKQTTWKAGRNFDHNTPLSSIKKLLGVLPRKANATRLPEKIHTVNLQDIPETFDAREAWPKCADIIGEIRDQAACGSCWAFGAVEAMSDRICISSATKTQVRISAEDLNSCCKTCGDGCNGGWPDEAWLYWAQVGIVTGGSFADKVGCKPYTIPPCNHHVDTGDLQPCGDIVATPECTKECADGNEVTDYTSDLTTGTAYSIPPIESQIQTDIMTNGPVEADFDVYEDFLSYNTGVYQHTEGEYAGGHAIKLLGWGVENKTPYWLAANSWNSNWGDKGYFKILRGSNHCGIEGGIVAGLPKLK